MKKAAIGFMIGVVVTAIVAVMSVRYLSQFPSPDETQLRVDLEIKSKEFQQISSQLAETKKDLKETKDKPAQNMREQRREEDAIRVRKQELQEVEDQINKLKSTLENLQAAVAAIKALRGADFIAIGGGAIVGITSQDDKFILAGKVSDPNLASVARRAVARWRMPLYTGDSDFCRKIVSAYTPGDILTKNDNHEVDAIYRNHRFVSVAPKGESEIVHFHDVETNALRIGYYLGNDSHSVTVNTIDKKSETVARVQVAEASAIRGSANALVQIAQQIDFIDLCCLEVARRIGTPEGKKGIRPKVVIKVVCGERNNNFSRHGYGQGSFQSLGNLQIPIKGFSSAGRFNHKAWADELQDLLYERLVHLGVVVVEREFIDILDKERKRNGLKNARERDELRLAGTHYFVCKINVSAVAHRSRLAIRLIDIDTEQVLWALSFSPSPSAENHVRFNVASGQLFLLNGSATPGLNSPPIFREQLDAGEKHTLDNRLIVFEKGMKSKERNAFRDPFNSRIVFIEEDKVKKNQMQKISSGKGLAKDKILKYMAYSLYRAAMPRAGVVAQVEDRKAFVRMEDSDKYVPVGSNVPVYHFDESEKRQNIPERLGVMLAVRDVTPKGFRVSFGGGRISPIWEEYFSLSVGDVVVPTGQKAPKIAIQGFDFVEPTGKFWTDTRSRTKVYASTMATAAKLSRRLAEACTHMGLDVVVGSSAQTRNNSRRRMISDENVQYFVTGTISPANKRLVVYNVKLSVVNRDKTPVLDEHLLVNSTQVEEWDPTQ